MHKFAHLWSVARWCVISPTATPNGSERRTHLDDDDPLETSKGELALALELGMILILVWARLATAAAAFTSRL
jgi:hypothetical protein